MRLERPETKVAVLVLLLSSLLSSTGCTSFYVRQAFNEARLGQPWSEVNGSEQFSKDRQLASYVGEDPLAYCLRNRPGEHEIDGYFIVVSDSGKVAAKAYVLKGSPAPFGLQIEAKYWQELEEVASHYPYYVDVDRGNVKWPEPVYPPLIHPFSADDKLLPSGVRQSTWAWFAGSLWGWPFTPRDERWARETKVYWNGTLRDWSEVVKSVDQLPTEGTITVFRGKGPLSRQGSTCGHPQ